MHAGLGEDNLVKGGIQLAVAEPGEAVATHPARGHLDRRAAGMTDERRIAGGTPCATDLDQETSGGSLSRGDEIVRGQPVAPRTLGRWSDASATALGEETLAPSDRA